MRTVVGVFSDRAEAEHVVRHLIDAGLPSDDVAVADPLKAEGHEWSERNIAACGGMSPGWFMAWLVPQVAKRMFPGAVAFGASIGGLAGLVAGFVALRVGTPAGPALTVFAGLGVGGIFGALIAGTYNLGVTHEEIPLQAEAVREKGVVVAAHVDEHTEAKVFKLMEEHNARALREDQDAWSASGWTGRSGPDVPYPSVTNIR